MRVAILLAVLAAAPKAGDTVVVKREGARLMASPRFFGKACPGEVKPGSKVKLLELQKGWGRVAAPGAGACWLHETAWTDRVAGALAGGQTSSQRDVELAGRGFSEAEEQRFKGEHADLAPAFRALDDHLDRGGETPPGDLERFAAEGKLGGGR